MYLLKNPLMFPRSIDWQRPHPFAQKAPYNQLQQPISPRLSLNSKHRSWEHCLPFSDHITFSNASHALWRSFSFSKRPFSLFSVWWISSYCTILSQHFLWGNLPNSSDSSASLHIHKFDASTTLGCNPLSRMSYIRGKAMSSFSPMWTLAATEVLAWDRGLIFLERMKCLPESDFEGLWISR